MVAEETVKFKQKFIDAPVEHFGYVTFGELSLGDKFIIFPLPAATRDGGFKASSGLLRKTKDTTKKTAGRQKHGTAFSMMMGRKMRITNSMPVIRIITKEPY
jgi:hypothetical protein